MGSGMVQPYAGSVGECVDSYSGFNLCHKTKKESSGHIFTTICCCVNNRKKPKLIILSLRSPQQLLGVFMQAELLAVIRTRKANTC